MPDIVIPMHYANKDTMLDIAPVDDFLDLFASKDIEYIKGNSIELNRTNFDGEKTRVIVLER